MDHPARKKAILLATVRKVVSGVHDLCVCIQTHSCPLVGSMVSGTLPPNNPSDNESDRPGALTGVCGAAIRKVKMNAGVRNRILPTALFLSTLLSPDRSTFAQTTEPPIVIIVASDHHAAEAEQDIGVFTVTRTGPTEVSLLVFYELSGTARNGVDYLELPKSITIPA